MNPCRSNRSNASWCAAALLMLAGSAAAQDSVATTPGASDALSPFGTQRVRYVVDLVPFTSSWGNRFVVGPVAKASLDNDPMFPNQLMGSVAVSPDQLTAVSFGAIDFSDWSSAGAGVNGSQNSAPGVVSVTGYDRQFGVGVSDLSANATNALGLLVGQDSDDLDRLYVTRTLALASRISAASADFATLALGAIDATGNLAVRADPFNALSPQKITGDNIVVVDTAARNASLNCVFNVGAGNLSFDGAATSYIVNASTTTLNTPALKPEAGVSNSLAVILDFANKYRPGAGAGVSTHLATGASAHRGNPTFSTLNPGAGVGMVASPARNTAGTLTNTINTFVISSTGAVLSKSSATLPVNITDGDGFTANAAGDAQFLHYMSQTSFRGGNGPVAVGTDLLGGSVPVLAAVATDPTMGEFVAVARLGAPTTWTVAAHEGKAVLDGPGGTTVATIQAASPATFSAPAADAFGNLYFIANVDAVSGVDGAALIKAVNTGSGYELEMLLKEGDTFTGADSATDYAITNITLADSDSIASGTMHGASVLQGFVPGEVVTDADSPFAFGGAVVSAEITYDRAGTPESYNVLLFVGPDREPAELCEGDATGDGQVNFDDLNLVLQFWGTAGPQGDVAPPGGDGAVDFGDLNLVLQNWQQACP